MNVLVVGAHPDDETIGAGGTIAKHIENGDHVYIVLFSVGHKPIQPNLREQAYQALKVFGINKNDLFWLNCKSGQFDLESKLKVNSKLAEIVAKIKPQIVYTHFYGDTHQDHRFVFDSTMVACRPSHEIRGITKNKNWRAEKNKNWKGVEKIFCYEIPSSTNWSGILSDSFNPTEYNVISEKHLRQKISAYNCYKNEVRPGNHPRSIESLNKLAQYRGSSVTVDLAEAFVLIRSINHD
jgi:LmbE family N-acetylglucosaminyl deacetylase